MPRLDGRRADQLRAIEIYKDYVSYPEGSVLFCMGKTKVLCNASIEEGQPKWMEKGDARGWVTGEYSLLPRSTHTRTQRETKGLGGRTQEIQRLIGRALRGAVHLDQLGPRTITIDCDVIQADGGTRTAAINGGFLALQLALKKLIASGKVPDSVIAAPVAAISTGVVGGELLLDLCYEEDVKADMDANFVMTGDGNIIEFQGTAEGAPVDKTMMNKLIDLAEKGMGEIFALQRAA